MVILDFPKYISQSRKECFDQLIQIFCRYSSHTPLVSKCGPWPAAAPSPGNVLETQIFGSTPDMLNQKFWGWDPVICVSISPPRASLVVQWLRVCLPMQGTRVRALVWEDPTCCGATKPVSHNYWACASEACAPQQERPRQWEARAPRWGVAPARHSWRKPSHRNEDPT